LQIQQYINAGVASYIHERFMQLATQSELLTSKRPHAQMQARQQRLLTLQTTLSRVASDGISQRSFRLNALRTRLESIGPMEVLGRGYSLTQDSSGKVVRTSKDVKEGELIRTVLADGTIQSKVECTS
jgi:exodeoxyribonuclease VII large subunit